MASCSTLRRRVLHFDVGKRVRAALVADQQRVALREIARVGRALLDFHQAAIAVLAVAGGDAFRDDRAARVLADVDHLRAGVGLLIIVRHGDRIKFADGIVALQNAARIFPGDGRAGLDLRPGNLRVRALCTGRAWSRNCKCRPAVLVAGIPVLHGGVFDLGVVQRDQVPPPPREADFRRASARCSLRVTHVGAFVGHDQRALELAGSWPR